MLYQAPLLTQRRAGQLAGHDCPRHPTVRSSGPCRCTFDGVTDRALARSLGLTDDEVDRIEGILERDPNSLELAMYSVMWSEHCSYKSSKLHLRRLPQEGSWV